MNSHSNSNSTAYEFNYQEGEEHFLYLLHLENLDQLIKDSDVILDPFEEALDAALSESFSEKDVHQEPILFIQRILYRINRLKLFWYDDLKNYTNEASPYLSSIRTRIESSWQKWEKSHLNIESLKTLPVMEALRNRASYDVSPEPSKTNLYFQNEMTMEGYRKLAGIASLDGLVESSQLSRVQGGVGNEVQSMLTKIFLEEYGGGKLSRKHTSFFSAMLNELKMNPEPEFYFDTVPWEVIANTNQSFVLCESKRNFLRYIGALLFTEISVPAAFNHYLQGGKRLGLSDKSTGYWDLHIKEDERHGQWMLDDVALPLVDKYGDSAWEIIWGYDQQKYISSRASQAIATSLREIEGK
ncbi:MAG: iron-containing redox enzyme family protein [Nitrospinales bacterium]